MTGAEHSRPPSAAPARQSGAALLRDPVLLPLLIGCALVGGGFLLDLGDPATQLRIFWSVVPIFNLVLWLIPRRLARVPGTPPPARRFWRTLSAAGLVFAAGGISQALVAWLRPGPHAALPNPFHAACVLFGNAAIMWVILTYPTPAASRQARVRYWLDATAVMVGVAVLVWFLTVPAPDAQEPLAGLLGALILLVTGLATVKLLLTGASPATAGAALPMLAAAALQGFTGGLASADSDHLHLALAARLLPAALLCAGPRIHEVGTRSDPQRLRQLQRRYNMLPYAALAGTFALLPVVLPARLDSRAWVTMAGLLIITCLVVGRQLLAFRENASLVTRLDASLLELGRQGDLMRSLLEHSTDITSIVNRRGAFTYLTPATERVLGREHRKLLGTRVVDYIHPDDLPEIMPGMVRLMTTPNATLTYQARYAHADGSWRWLEVVSRNLTHDASVGGVVSNARDVTEARMLQDQLRYQASHDSLTGLANRALFGERLSAATRAGRAAVLLIDLDDFKSVNDTYGHHVGDAVLIGVADRLRACVPDEGTAARLGGDEFAVVLPGADTPTGQALASRFLTLLAQPMTIEGSQLSVNASVGLVTGDATEADELLRLADATMYRAKRDSETQLAVADAATQAAVGH
ncbi:PAS domain S-box-containing protein/diguanylate cyclase (GGDEF) domain-containing protein [Micromonospora pattaloongensis]|uniref:PAS domain S-box-containing protein/diguanylate cyclase (GGDEF) domain-containing protein n=1 Tax=Micromonospora pattaloongensis TaxID=405436 RepID=A0A1H3TAC3_9ACTN|nr:sensor domain-containing diguanylate cyclase [Micromonospora pattaloongensis]SDZ47253.1 PAS domain S-box-containing protein/diguanylate cyclase (GGDEF) domain-containing protein [Micromonospora pattaloongensis]